jgi:hypothetical protein
MEKILVGIHEISHHFFNPKVHYSVHISPPLEPILSQLNPFYTFTHISLTLVLILSFHLPLGLPSNHFSLGFLTMRVTCPAYPILLDLIAPIILIKLSN